MGNKTSTGTIVAGVIVAGVVVGGLAWALSSRGDDERPPIIVRNGTLIFDSGDASGPATQWKAWKKDTIGNQWKPDHDTGKHVLEFEVTLSGFTSPPVCATTALRGEEVHIKYKKSANDTNPIDFRVYIRKKVGSPNNGRREPKIDSPEPVTAATTGSAPPTLTYDDQGAGWVSEVTVGTNPSCALPDPDPQNDAERRARRIRIRTIH